MKAKLNRNRWAHAPRVIYSYIIFGTNNTDRRLNRGETWRVSCQSTNFFFVFRNDVYLPNRDRLRPIIRISRIATLPIRTWKTKSVVSANASMNPNDDRTRGWEEDAKKLVGHRCNHAPNVYKGIKFLRFFIFVWETKWTFFINFLLPG